MYDMKWIRDNAALLDTGLARRGLEPVASALLELDEQRREAVSTLQVAQERRNAASREIGQAKAARDDARAAALMAEVAEIKSRMAELETREAGLNRRLQERLAAIPNLPLEDVPDGTDETGNVEHHRYGAKPDIASPRQHFELGEALGLMDFEAAARLSGSRFVVTKGALARLERALAQFMLDLHTQEHGYTEVNPPLLVRDGAMFGTAQLPKFREDQFLGAGEGTRSELLREALRQVTPDQEKAYRAGDISLAQLVDQVLGQAPSREDFWLIPTAEVPLTNLVRESVVAEEALPLRLTACTPCFRAEAGAAGRDTRGMLRQHQFTKVELVSITTPEASRDEHERMLACAEEVLRRLELHYRVVTLCTGDMGFASRKTYDIEVWVPGQQTYREISSCSVCGEFQAIRMNARYKGKDGKAKGFVHTLNGSGVAVGRALIAVMENYQNPDGSITVPAVLKPYMGGLERIG